MMRIPDFVSCPTGLSPAQEASGKVIVNLPDELHLGARALGRTDYPDEYPLGEVWVIARWSALALCSQCPGMIWYGVST
jgi:hypothetical protein